MKNNFRLTLLAKCVLSASTSVITAGALLSPVSVIAAPLPTGMINGVNGVHHVWLVDKPNGAGMLKKGDANQNVYFSHQHRGEHDTQTLVVQGTDLSGHYINISDKGTANVMMNDKAHTDFIEAGNPGSTTNTHIILNNSTLDGPKRNHNYDDKTLMAPVHDKNYLDGAAVYLDRQDSGELTVGILNHSTVNGDIFASKGGKKRVEITDSALHKGGIVFDGPSENVLTVNNGLIDAAGRTGKDQSYAVSLTDSKDNTINIAKKSTLNGGVHISGSGHNDNIAISNSTLNAINGVALDDSGAKHLNLDVTGSQLAGDIKIDKAYNTDLNLRNSALKGSLAVNSLSHANISIQNSQLSGALNVSGTGRQNISVDHSSLNGIDAHSATSDMDVTVQNHSRILGNIQMGTGTNTLTLADASLVEGNVDGGSANAKNALLLKNGSGFVGKASRFATITNTDHNLVITPDLVKQTITLQKGSRLFVNKLADATINTDTSSHFSVAGSMSGSNSINVGMLSPETTPGSHEIGVLEGGDLHTTKVGFANHQLSSTARQGVYNYDLGLYAQQSETTSNGKTPVHLVVDMKQQGLANDVKGAIAGLEGAKRDSAAVTNSITNHMNALSVDNAFNGAHPGVGIWGDYLSQNSDNKDAVNYHNALRGTTLGMDWTWVPGNGDNLTTGVAFSQVKDKLSGITSTDHFSNKLNGDYYSLYGGWQQALTNQHWGFFTDGSASYGENTFALSSSNVGTSTSAVEERLHSGYKGKVYSAQLRSGINLMPTPSLLLQPYAVAGWSKAEAHEFSNTYVNFNAGQISAWYAGGGARITTKFGVGHVTLKPWLDASYISEFSNKDTLMANAQPVSNAKSRHYTNMGAGVGADFTDDLSVNVGAFSSAGDAKNNLNVQAGVKYNF